jgi:hypothetical protein
MPKSAQTATPVAPVAPAPVAPVGEITTQVALFGSVVFDTLAPVAPPAAPVVQRAVRKSSATPTGKRAILIELASRPQGATTDELAAATGWIVASPWKWEFTRKDGKGAADVYGYDLAIARLANGRACYTLTKRPAPQVDSEA